MNGEEFLLALGNAESRLVEEALTVPPPFGQRLSARLAGRKWVVIAAAAAFVLVFCGVLAIVKSQPRTYSNTEGQAAAPSASDGASAYVPAATAYSFVGGTASPTVSATAETAAPATTAAAAAPSAAASTAAPTAALTAAPTAAPATVPAAPVVLPTAAPTAPPTDAPTEAPAPPATTAPNTGGGGLLSAIGGFLGNWLGSLSGSKNAAGDGGPADADAPAATAAPAPVSAGVSAPQLSLSVAAREDGTVAVTAGLKNAVALTSLDLSLSYDALALELVEVREEPHGMQQSALNKSRNPILFGGYYDEPLSAEACPLFTAVFRRSDQTAPTELLLTARGCHVQDPDRPLYGVSVTNAVEAVRCTLP